MNFGFKKYLISMSLCLVFIFVLIFNLFAPVPVFAELTREEVVKVSSYAEYSCPYNYSNVGLDDGKIILFKDLVSGYTDFFIYSLVGTTGNISVTYYCCNETITAKNGGSNNYNSIYVGVGSGIKISITKYSNGNPTGFSYTSTSRSTVSFTSKPAVGTYYMYFTNSPVSSNGSSEEDSSFLERLGNGFKNLWDSTFENSLDFGDTPSDIVNKFNSQGQAYVDFAKTVLCISDDDTSTLNTVMNDIYNNDYTSDFWTNVDSNTINSLSTQFNNLKNMYYNEVTFDVGTGTYNFVNYNPSTNTYPLFCTDNNYYNNYINTTVNNDVDTNVNNIISYLRTISNTLNTKLNGINTSITVGFESIGSLFDDLKSHISLCFADLSADINGYFTGLAGALGGIIAGGIAGALGIADVDFNLDSIFKDLILKLGDIEIAVKGDSTSSDDDTTNNYNIDMSQDFKTNLKDILGDINIDLTNKLRSLFDDINIDLTNKFRQLFDDIKIKVVVDNDINTDIDTPIESTVTDVTTEPIVSDIPSESTVIDVTTEPIVSDIPGESTVTDVPVEPIISDVPEESTITEVTTTYDIVEPTEPLEDDFWKQVRDIIITKIPLYSQCVELLEPFTSVSSDNLLDYSQDNSIENVSSINDDGQMDLFETTDTTIFDGLAVISTNPAGNVVALKIPINLNIFGISDKFYILNTESYTNSTYRTTLTYILATISYILFCWRVVHKVSRLFNHDSVGGDS